MNASIEDILHAFVDDLFASLVRQANDMRDSEITDLLHEYSDNSHEHTLPSSDDGPETFDPCYTNEDDGDEIPVVGYQI